jgi:hypothetical protein
MPPSHLQNLRVAQGSALPMITELTWRKAYTLKEQIFIS